MAATKFHNYGASSFGESSAALYRRDIMEITVLLADTKGPSMYLSKCCIKEDHLKT